MDANSLPKKSELGILPPGVHLCSLEEIEMRFATNSDRKLLFDSVARLHSDLRSREIQGHLIIGGSFPMECIEKPNDVDILLGLDSEWVQRDEIIEKYESEDLWKPVFVHKTYAGLHYWVRPDVNPLYHGVVELFQQPDSKHGFPDKTTIGIVKIKISDS